MLKFPATRKYLDLLKTLYSAGSEPASDYRIALELDVKHQTVSLWNNDKCGMSEDTAMIVADRLEMDVVEVVTEVNKDRASSRAAREYYDRILTRFRNTAAVAVVALSGMQSLTTSVVFSV